MARIQYLLLVVILFFSCKKQVTDNTVAQFKSDSAAISGTYSGLYVINRQIAYTQSNTYDTLPVHVQVNLIDATHIDVASSNSDYHDTLIKTIDSTTLYGENTYYYVYNTHANNGIGFVVNVYYFAVKDSLYINAFAPPCCGYNTYYLFHGKK